MPVKPETILKRIESLPDHQAKPYLEFKSWLENDEDNSERNWVNYFKVLVLFSDDIGHDKHLDRVTKDDVLSFLDKRKKNAKIDPEKK